MKPGKSLIDRESKVSNGSSVYAAENFNASRSVSLSNRLAIVWAERIPPAPDRTKSMAEAKWLHLLQK